MPTPSPWYARETFVGQSIIASEATGASVAVAYDAADGPMLAAAPELYAALRDLVARCDGEEGIRADGSNIETMRAHAALAKADGRAE